MRAELLPQTSKQKAGGRREKEETAEVYINTIPFVTVKVLHCYIVSSTVSSNFGMSRSFCFSSDAFNILADF